MTFHITRHAQISVPVVLQQQFRTKELAVPQKESKGIKKFLQKSIFMIPVTGVGSGFGMLAVSPDQLASFGSNATMGIFLAIMATTMIGLLVVPTMMQMSIEDGSKKYFPGKAVTKIRLDKPEKIEPYAEWDKVFLPYATESFNGVQVKDAEGNSRKPVRLYLRNYIELRTEPKTEDIDYTLVEAQKI